MTSDDIKGNSEATADSTLTISMPTRVVAPDTFHKLSDGTRSRYRFLRHPLDDQLRRCTDGQLKSISGLQAFKIAGNSFSSCSLPGGSNGNDNLTLRYPCF